jgi:hypothetical protein
MQQYESAFEQVTLQRLHDFCHHITDNKSFRVVYLHNKGSLNDRDGQNQIWRRHMTAAVTSQDCLEPPDDACNVCGLQFWPQWSTFIPGNMWTAKCSYVKQLLPPNQFESHMQELAEQTRHRNETGQLTIRMFPANEDQLGLGRFATEHWIAVSTVQYIVWMTVCSTGSLYEFTRALTHPSLYSIICRVILL